MGVWLVIASQAASVRALGGGGEGSQSFCQPNFLPRVFEVLERYGGVTRLLVYEEQTGYVLREAIKVCCMLVVRSKDKAFVEEERSNPTIWHQMPHTQHAYRPSTAYEGSHQWPRGGLWDKLERMYGRRKRSFQSLTVRVRNISYVPERAGELLLFSVK